MSIQVRKEQCLLKCSEHTTMQIHRTNFPMSWDQCWETAPLLWCDLRENHFSRHSVKNYQFRHCTVGLQGSVKLMLAPLPSKIPVCLWGCPRCHLPAGVPPRNAFHPCSPAVLLLSCRTLLTSPPSPFAFSYSPMASCKLCSDFFHLSLTSGCKELATNQLVTQEQSFKNRKAQTKHWLVMLASTLAFTDRKQKQLYRGEGCYTF